MSSVESSTFSGLSDNYELHVDVESDDVHTAESIEHLPAVQQPAVTGPPRLFFGVHTEDAGEVPAAVVSQLELRFALQEDVDLVVHVAPDEIVTIRSEASGDAPCEWFLLAQVRFQAGAGHSGPLRVVDSDVFLFSPYAKPIRVHLRDRQLTRMRMDFRWIYKRCHKLDDFPDGDLVLDFGEAGRIQTFRSLLSMHSEQMAYMIDAAAKQTEEGEQLVLQLPAEDWASFRELLFHVYPAQRPLHAHFRDLCSAALKYGFKAVQSKLVDYLVGFEHVPFERKVKDAAEMQLNEAVKKLVYNAQKTGFWAHLITRGFDPKEAFGEKVYFELVPNASGHDAPYPEDKKAEAYDPERPTRHSIKILHCGATFYANYGLMAVHNLEVFGRGNAGEYFPHMTVELRRELVKSEVSPAQLLRSLLEFIHVPQASIPAAHIRPLLIFASIHQMPHVRFAMEDALILEPPSNDQQLFECFRLAEKWELPNLMRASLLRVENACNSSATHMIEKPQFLRELTLDTQQQIADHLCSGWAIKDRRLGARLPTKQLERSVSLNEGGPVPVDEGRLHSFYEMNSEEAFGPPDEQQ
ncbi:BTB domain-containing protein [Aphelenchoides fujianensis]|nr:BTB domain-containing protein [Aphelenchoides fujianensis]